MVEQTSKGKQRIEKAEIKRLSAIYENLLPKQKALAQGLIAQAARLRMQLNELNKDIHENGLTELFRQSDKVDPYVRTRPQADLFVKLDKNYQAIIRQLTDMLPPEDEPDDDLANYRNGNYPS